MSCCGNKRQNLQYDFQRHANLNEELARPNKLWGDISFEYTGEAGLTVKGSITGKHYRFNYKGDVQAIDYRDAGAMMAISSLKRIKS